MRLLLQLWATRTVLVTQRAYIMEALNKCILQKFCYFNVIVVAIKNIN